MNAYTAWINSQLKKRSQQIQDLSLDLKDGYALATVIEIVCKYKINFAKVICFCQNVVNVLTNMLINSL